MKFRLELENYLMEMDKDDDVQSNYLNSKHNELPINERQAITTSTPRKGRCCLEHIRGDHRASCNKLAVSADGVTPF